MPARDRRSAERVRKLCAETLASNWTVGSREGVEFAYTRPSPERYPWQWYWDSCFSAIVWRRLDREHSRLELESLLAAAREDGFIGHTIFWERPVSGVRRLYYNVIEDDDFMTATIQPPMLAWAWRIAVGDPAREPGIVAHHDFVARERDLEGDGLLWLLQPDESGLDASPQFDPIWRRRAQGLPGFLELVHRNRRLGFDGQAAALARGALKALARSGLREFYDPFDGRGMGATDFAWSALALELLDPDERAARSHI